MESCRENEKVDWNKPLTRRIITQMSQKRLSRLSSITSNRLEPALIRGDHHPQIAHESVVLLVGHCPNVVELARSGDGTPRRVADKRLNDEFVVVVVLVHELP